MVSSKIINVIETKYMVGKQGDSNNPLREVIDYSYSDGTIFARIDPKRFVPTKGEKVEKVEKVEEAKTTPEEEFPKK